MKATPRRLLAALAVALTCGALGAAAWGQDGFGSAVPSSSPEPAAAQPGTPPPVVADGIYAGELWEGLSRSQARHSSPLKVQIRGTEVAGQCRVGKTDYQLKGTYDRERGVISGKVHGTEPVTNENGSFTYRYDVSFHGTIENGELKVQSHGETEGEPGYVGPWDLGLAVEFGEPEPPPPGPRIGLNVTIHWSPEQPKPGDQVTVWADITGTDGKPVTGAKKIWDVLKYAGDADPRFTWDGKEVPLKLIVVHNDNEYKFTRTLPADGAAPPAEAGPGGVPGLGGAGKVPGPASILSGIVGTLAPGVIGILGGLVGGLRRPQVPTSPPPGPRRPPSRPPPPPPDERMKVPPPPEKPPLKPPPPPGDEAAKLREKLDRMRKRADRIHKPELTKWADDTGKAALKPDGTVDKEKLKESYDKLGGLFNLPDPEAGKGVLGGLKDLAGLGLDVTKGLAGGLAGAMTGGDTAEGQEYGKAALETVKTFGSEVAGGVKTFVGGIVGIPGQVLDGVGVIGRTVRDLKYFGRGLDDKARNWINTEGAADKEAFRNAMKEGRYLDALGNLAKGVGNIGAALGGKVWEVAKEFLPADEIKSFFGSESSLGERLWAVPSGIAKTLGLLMGFEKTRNLLGKPVPGLDRWAPLSTAGKGLEKAGTAAGKKWTEWRAKANLPPEPPRLGGDLGKLQDKINDAVNTTNETERARKIEQIYQQGGMKDLKKLQEAGGLSAKQAEALNKTITNTVNETVDQSVRNTVRDFHKSTGVKVKEVIVADSGSSAAKGARSIYTDADRTKLITLDSQDVATYAGKHGISEAEAYNRLSKMAQEQINKGVARGLKRAGLTVDDVGYGSYRGIGSGAGPADAYPQSWTEQNTMRNCKATSYRPDPKGGVRSHSVGARQVMDEGQMINHKYNGGTLSDAKKTFADSIKVLRQQSASIDKAGVSMDKVAKAVLRGGQETALRGGPVDPKLIEIADLVKKNPQDVNKILAANHLTEEAFRNWGRAAIKGASDWMNV